MARMKMNFLRLSHVAAHRDGRKFHSCPVAAIPAWANKLSGDAAHFITAAEYDRLVTQ